MKAFYITLSVLGIYLAGFVSGGFAYKTLIDHINAEVASKLDDVKVLQQAGYNAPFAVDSLEPTRWSE